METKKELGSPTAPVVLPLQGLLTGSGDFPTGPHQRTDAGTEATGDPEPAPAAAADAAAAAGAAADADDARAGLEHDPQHGCYRGHTSNHEQPTDPTGERTAVPISSKLRYWFYPPLLCNFSTVLSPLSPQDPIPQPLPCPAPQGGVEVWASQPSSNVTWYLPLF